MDLCQGKFRGAILKDPSISFVWPRLADLSAKIARNIHND